MFDILCAIVFCWLAFLVLRLMLKIAWGTAKLVAIVLFVLAIPAMLGCLLMAGGFVLLLPVGLIGIALGILKACV